MSPPPSEKAPPPSSKLWLLLTAIGAAVGVLFGVVVGRLSFGPPLVMLAIGGVTLALAGLAAWRTLNPLVDPSAVERMTAPTEPGRIRDLQREKVSVLKAIKEVDADFQMRKISESDYEEMTRRYRNRALRIIRELEIGDDVRALIEHELKSRLAAAGDAPAPKSAALPDAPPPEGPLGGFACDACGASNDSDARFCKKCGKALNTAPVGVA